LLQVNLAGGSQPPGAHSRVHSRPGRAGLLACSRRVLSSWIRQAVRTVPSGRIPVDIPVPQKPLQRQAAYPSWAPVVHCLRSRGCMNRRAERQRARCFIVKAGSGTLFVSLSRASAHYSSVLVHSLACCLPHPYGQDLPRLLAAIHPRFVISIVAPAQRSAFTCLAAAAHTQHLAFAAFLH
jgi:hypothetical protein